ncbi:MAG TPA: AAA family ATPase [Polyangiaceae bacterium]|nr:AAA family ATPase [Polyangiaceae bacterium]
MIERAALYNPFQAIHADAWAAPIDVASINRDVSDLILHRIEQVRRAGEGGDAALSSTSVLLLGPAGSGKTHLFARLRKRAGRRAVFILSRPEIGFDPAPRHVLASIVDSLRRSVAGDEHKQIDAIVGEILASFAGESTRYPFTLLDDKRREPREKQRELIERILDQVEERFPEIWPAYLERLLWVPFCFEEKQKQRGLLAWLSGREPDPIELDRIGASGPLSDIDVMPALRTLGVAAAFGAPLVLVFDQLENLAEEGGKTGRILAHARLVSELRDTVRGLVIVQMALDSEWATRIHPVLHGSDRARLEETVKHLSLPTAEERRALLDHWREALPEADREKPPPYPFSPEDVSAWIHSDGMTPRMLMQACGEAYLRAQTSPAPGEAAHKGAAIEAAPPANGSGGSAPPAPNEPASQEERLEIQWNEALARARLEIDEAAEQARGVPPERIAGGLLAALRLLGVEVNGPPAKGFLSLRVSLPAPAVTREVFIAQQPHPKSLAAAVREAARLAEAHPVLVLRERALTILPTWKDANKQIAAFTAMPRAELAPLDREDIARLLALSDYLTSARSLDISAADGRPIPYKDVAQWAAKALDPALWGPLQRILAQPAAPVAAPPGPTPQKPPSPAPPAPPSGKVPLPSGPSKEGAPAVARTTFEIVRAAIQRLRVASVDRLVREAKASDKALTRAAVTEELRRLPVQFFGEAIVALKGEGEGEAPWR